MTALTPAKADETTDLRDALGRRLFPILCPYATAENLDTLWSDWNCGGYRAAAYRFADALIAGPLAQREAAHAAEIQAREAQVNGLAELYGVACGDLAESREQNAEMVRVIGFALTISDHYDMRDFLRGWSEGDVSEWPEFGEGAEVASE